ncbi:hypothetical protein ACQY0O_003869 [Thecaphora frezii]
MLFRPVHAVLVAASIYLGGLGAASAPMWPGDELSSALPNFVRSTFNTANNGALASRGGLRRSQTLDATQMPYYESFGRQMLDPPGAFHHDAGSQNAHYVERGREPFGATQYHDSGYGSMQANPLDTYGFHRYNPHSGLSIGFAPSSHQQQESFGHPGIPSLVADQHDQARTAFHGNDLDAQHAGVAPYPAPLPISGTVATPQYLPHPSGYSQGFRSFDGVPVGPMSYMRVDGQNPAYQGVGHPTAVFPDVIDDPGPVEVEAKTAKKKKGFRNRVSKQLGGEKGPFSLADINMRNAVLVRVRRWLIDHYNDQHEHLTSDDLEKVCWKQESFDNEELTLLYQGMWRRLYEESSRLSMKKVALNWKVLMQNQGTRFDLDTFRIIFSLDDENKGPTEVFRVAAYNKAAQKWSFVGLLEMPAKLKA